MKNVKMSISKFTNGMNSNFDQQLKSLDTDPEQARRSFYNEQPEGAGGLEIFEQIQKGIRPIDINLRQKIMKARQPSLDEDPPAPK